MQIVERIFINRPREAVWDFIRDPENMLRWNPKVSRVTPSVFADIGQGYRYTISYTLNPGRQSNEFQAEFVLFDPPAALRIQLQESHGSVPDRTIEESYELTEQDGGTFLTQTIMVQNSGINLFWRLLIWAIRKWGKPVGKPYLAGLRDILESAPSQS